MDLLLPDPASLQSVLADLSDTEWTALKVVFFNGGPQGITVELCHQIVTLASGRRRKTSSWALAELQKRGLIYVRSQNYRQVFYIPTDLYGALSEILGRQLVYQISPPQGVSVQPIPAQRDLMEDAHRFLAYLLTHEVAVTQQGRVFKRHVRTLTDLLTTDGKPGEGAAGRYPEPLGLLIGYSLDRQLITRQDGRLMPTDRLTDWVQKPSGVKQLDLFQYWQNRYFYQDLQTFLVVMRTVGEIWVLAERLVDEMEPLVNPSQQKSFLQRIRHHLSSFLVPLGLFELGRPGGAVEADPACRLTAAGTAVLGGAPPPSPASTSSIVIQGNFEVMATRPLETQALWNLERMGTLVQRTDQTLTYRLSRQSVYQALKTGMTGQEMLSFLEKYGVTGVPQNVAFDLMDWAESYGQVYLQSVTLLRCASPVLAQQIKASRRTARFILGQLTPTDLIVRAEQYKELLEALEADGLMPQPGIQPIR